MRARLVSLDEALPLAGGKQATGRGVAGLAQLNFNDAKLKS